MSKNNTLNKCDELIARLQELKKALGDVNSIPTRKPVNGLGAGWSQNPSTGSFHHSTHGVISTSKHPAGHFQITHGGRPVGRAASAGEAGHKIKSYVGSLQTGDTGSHSVNPMAAQKSDEDEDVEKSNYGKFKGGNQYSAADNAKRKMNNVGVTEGVGSNSSTKSYSSKPGQLSAKEQAAAEARKAKSLSGPVKQYSPEQIAAINEARKLKKNVEGQPWATHTGVPNADSELAKMQRTNPVDKTENVMSNQLANMMNGKAMLGTPPPRQPTDQEMFGHLVPSEEEIQKAESAWGNKMNWLEEAMKPIASRFDSPEEEAAYWDSIKVKGSGRDDYGF